MNIRKLSFIVLAGGLLFGNQEHLVLADTGTPASPGSAVHSASAVATGSSANGIENRSSLRADREAIHEDRVNVRDDRASIEKNRQDIRAAEHDIQINPQNKSTDQARIAADQKSIKSERNDLKNNERHLRQDQHSLRPAAAHQHQNPGGAQKPSYSNGFFPPTNRPAQNHNGVSGFGGETHHERHHHAR